MEKVQQEEPNVFELVIGLTKDGSASVSINTLQEGHEPNPYILVGLLEQAKADILNSLQPETPQQMEQVEVVLEEFDFSHPSAESLKKQGLKIGDKVKLPKPVAEVRAAALEEFKAAAK